MSFVVTVFSIIFPHFCSEAGFCLVLAESVPESVAYILPISLFNYFTGGAPFTAEFIYHTYSCSFSIPLQLQL